MSSKDIKLFEADRISRDPLDSVQIGDWYWVKYGKTESEKEHEHLFCVETIGSNYVGFTGSAKHSRYTDRVHFDEFFARCRSEPNWREHLQKRMGELQEAIKDKTRELVAHGQKLFLLPQAKGTEVKPPEEAHSLLPMKVADEPKKYKKELLKLQDKTLPAISKEIDELAEEYAVVAKDMTLPDLVRLEAVKEKLGVVEDRIFTIELYCGLQEEVHQIAKGNPAPATEKIAIRQAMLFMDEETLFDYEDGGMDIEKLRDFDEWVVKPENLNRVLPEQKGIVAFRVRRGEKDYGRAESFLQAWIHCLLNEENMKTYLLIRNGENVYRIASTIDFSPRLIPMEGEIGEEQFKKIHERYEWQEEEHTHKRVTEEEKVTPDSTEYDDHVKKLEGMLKQYNRIVILIQGLLDRSMVFHPHPPIKLMVPGILDEWVRLIRDEERGLPNNTVTFEEYQKQLNSTLRKGKWVYIDSKYNERYKNGETPYRDSHSHYREPTRRGWSVNSMPDICRVDSMKRDGSAVQVSWPWGQLSKGKEIWVENPNKPGWGHTKHEYETDRMCHEWIPVKRVLNVSDYNLGDYKMFLCDRALKGAYLKWSQYILIAEDWARNRAKGVPPDKDKRAQVKR